MQTRSTILYCVLVIAFASVLVFGPVPEAMPVAAQASDHGIGHEEMAGLQFMREEEKLARDVYLTLNELWNLRIFQNISEAEQRHMDSVAVLLNRYGIEDPAAGNGIGAFANADLQVLYDQLIDEGSRSMTDALRVGAAIEEIDILDLEERLAHTNREDIRRLYAKLLRGSNNHLRAFVSNLERRRQQEYEPQYLDQTAYDEIMAGNNMGHGSKTHGQRGRGRSR